MSVRAARLVGAAAALGGLLAMLAPASAVQTRSQLFFRNALLSDVRTSAEIEDLLRDGGGFVERAITVADLTGDDRDDALVRVSSGGAVGVVAVYVLSTHGGRATDDLRVILRRQRLLRASTRVDGSRLAIRTADYAPGDELCCPSRLEETDLAWSDRDRRFRVTGRRDVPPPVPTPSPTPTPTPTPR